MGNEDKVGKDLVVSRRAFLRDDLEAVGHAANLYNLEKEFTKTRKNRRTTFFFVLLGFTAGLVLGAIGIGFYVFSSSRVVPVDIKDFQDERLRDVLRQQSRGQNAGANLEQELAGLREEKEGRVRAARSTAVRERESLAGMSLNAEERRKKLAEIAAREQGSLERIEAEYGPRIAQKEEALKNAGTGVNQGLVEAAQRDESLLASGDKLSAMRLKAARDTYEERIRRMQVAHDLDIKNLIALYNPTFAAGDRTFPVMSAPAPSVQDVTPRPWDRQLATEAGVSPEELAKLRRELSNQLVLVRRLRQVSYLNSVPGVLERIDRLTLSMVEGYESLWERLNGALRRRVQAVGAYETAMASYSREKSDNGYVLDARDLGRIAVYLAPLYQQSASGGSALVYRSEDETIGKIEFFQADGRTFGRLVETNSGKSLQPFDRILVIKK
ncbi:MAG: hypothetical protein J0L75_20180 [Spirochaetes bacterium]|nr:hypothetical protein [Spirochaetota bacterium]